MKQTTHKANTDLSCMDTTGTSCINTTKTEPLYSILTQLEKQPDTSNNNTNISNELVINNTTHDHKTSDTEHENNLKESEDNNVHLISEKGNQ